MKILGIKDFGTYGAGVKFQTVTEHKTKDNREFIIVWQHDHFGWHKFVSLISKNNFDTSCLSNYSDVEAWFEFKKTRKRSIYLSYLGQILDQQGRLTKLDDIFTSFERSEVEMFDENSLIRKMLQNANGWVNDFKDKIIRNRRSYLKKNYGCVDGYILAKKLS